MITKSRAVVFAGQGAQAVGMGKDLAEQYPECKALFDKADEVLGYKLSKICFEGPVEELTKTSHCQPAIFVVSKACILALLREVGGTGLEFKGTAGLSLGEWTALHMAEVLTFEDTVRVLAARGRFMQEACEERAGGMVSVIGLPVEKLREICTATGAEIANLNSKEQTVLSGPKEAIAAASKMAGEAGAKKTVALNVAGAYHSSLMSSAAKKLEAMLESVQFKSPAMPVIANVTGLPHGLPQPEEVKKALSSRTAQLSHGSPEDVKRTMVKQVTSPVQWLSSIEWFRNSGVTDYIEFGPGRVLSGLISRIHKEATLSNVQDVASLKQTAEAIGKDMQVGSS